MVEAFCDCHPHDSARWILHRVPSKLSKRLTSALGLAPGGPGMMPGPAPHSMAMTPAHLAQQQQQQQASQLAKLKSRKPTDKALPDGVIETLVDPQIGLDYEGLRDFERRLDATMTRKRLDIVDSVNRPAKRYRTLRVWITNTVEDQTWQDSMNLDSFDFSPTLESSYRVKIEGRLLDEDDKPDKDKAAGSATRARFSNFFKSITVDFASARVREVTAPVEWKKPDRSPAGSNVAAAADFDELTFKRNGDDKTKITINLVRHEEPDRFALSPLLADLLDMREGTRAEVVMAMWEYINLTGLQEDEEKRNFRCDDMLRRVIQRDNGHIPHLDAYITPHLLPLPPIRLSYMVRVDKEFHDNPKPTVYDVRVAVDDPMRVHSLLPFVHNPQYAGVLKDVAAMDDQMATLMQAVVVSRAKHAFLMGLSSDPVRFTNDWLSSQKRDLEILTGEAPRGGDEAASADEWRRGGAGSVWGSQMARETVNYHLSKQNAAPR